MKKAKSLKMKYERQEAEIQALRNTLRSHKIHPNLSKISMAYASPDPGPIDVELKREPTPPSMGTKYDGGKIQLELLSSQFIFGLGRVLTHGAKKYATHNWRKGIEISRCIGAALRHIFAYLAGEDLDPESGLPHLHHAGVELMFASELQKLRPDLDDRFKTGLKGADFL